MYQERLCFNLEHMGYSYNHFFMSFSDNFHLCIGSGSVLSDWFFSLSLFQFCCCFECLVIFDGIPDIGFWIYCYKYSWFFFWDYKLFINSLILLGISFLRSIGENGARVRPVLTFPISEARPSLCSTPYLERFSSLADGDRHYFPWV